MWLLAAGCSLLVLEAKEKKTKKKQRAETLYSNGWAQNRGTAAVSRGWHDWSANQQQHVNIRHSTGARRRQAAVRPAE